MQRRPTSRLARRAIVPLLREAATFKTMPMARCGIDFAS
jgi:hypothetical protein